MPKRANETAIEYLIRRRYPNSKAITATDPEALTACTAELQKKTPLELDELVVTQETIEAAERDRELAQQYARASAEQSYCKREIDYLIWREFSGSPNPTIVDVLRNQVEIGERRAQFRKLSPDELRTLVTQAQKADEAADCERRERATPPFTEPIWSYWIQRRDDWSLCEGVLLLIGVEPRAHFGATLKMGLLGRWGKHPKLGESKTLASVYEGSIENNLRVSLEPEWGQLSNLAREKLLEADQILRHARRSVQLGKLATRDDEMVIPRDFLLWSADRGYAIPPELHELMGDEKSRDELKQENARLAAELEELTRQRDQLRAELDAKPIGWPWGSYETEYLRVLAKAITRYWLKYNAEEPRTANKNETVSDWIQTQKVRGKKISDRVAKIMAQIIRADGLPPGPRK